MSDGNPNWSQVYELRKKLAAAEERVRELEREQGLHIEYVAVDEHGEELAAAEERVRELEAERHRTLTLLALNKRHLGFADLHGDYYVVKVADMDAARLTAEPEGKEPK